MKHEIRSASAAITTVLASLPWWWILTFGSALLGSAGSAMATVVTGWLSPVLLCVSILLMGRSFYVIYVKKISTRATVVITWFAFTFMAGFWTWYLALGGSDVMRELFKPNGS